MHVTHSEVTKEDLDALEDELGNLLAALDYAYAAKHWESVMGLAKEICAPYTGVLAIRGYWDEAIKWGERAAEAASQANFPSMAAIFSGNVGTIRQQRGDLAEAQEASQKALLLFQEEGDERNLAVTLHQLGAIATAQGEYEKAKRLYTESLQIKRRLGNEAMGVANSDGSTFHQLGIIAHLQGDYEEAKRLYDESLGIFEQLGDQAGIAKSLHNLGVIAQDEGRYQQAKDLYQHSLEIKSNLGDQAGIGSSLHQLGIIAYLQGDYEEAKRLYDESLEIFGQLRDQAGIAKSLHQLGRIGEETGEVEEAAQLYREALAIFERLGSPYAEIARESLARLTGEKRKE